MGQSLDDFSQNKNTMNTTETEEKVQPTWMSSWKRIRAKMAARRAEKDALKDMGMISNEENIPTEQPKTSKERKKNRQEKKEKKLAKIKEKKIEASKPKVVPVLEDSKASLLRGVTIEDDNEWLSHKRVSEILGIKHPDKSSYDIEKRNKWEKGPLEFLKKSVRAAVEKKIDQSLLRKTTAWIAEYLQEPIVDSVPDGWIEIHAAAEQANVSMRTFIKRKEKNHWCFRHLRIRQEDGTVKICTLIDEGTLKKYIHDREKQVYGKSDWEYRLSRRAQCRNNRRRR